MSKEEKKPHRYREQANGYKRGRDQGARERTGLRGINYYL